MLLFINTVHWKEGKRSYFSYMSFINLQIYENKKKKLGIKVLVILIVMGQLLLRSIVLDLKNSSVI